MALPQSTLRAATDTRLFGLVIDHGRVTRSELAVLTGISKPTVSEGVRRLVDAGLVDATGPKETGRRGRVGTYYELGSGAGWVLAVEVDQAGVLARSADLAGGPLHEHRRPPGHPGDTRALTEALRAVVRAAVATVTGRGPLRVVAVSMAGPVHPETHEVIALPNSPFPEGLVSPAAVLSDVVDVPVLVDNDVNLAALAEHRAGAAVGASGFAYVYVGAGLGVGLYVGDRLIRGAHGLAGEVGYLPGSAAAPTPPGTLAAELSAAGFGRSDAPSIDLPTVLRVLDDPSEAAEGARALLGSAVARAIASVTAVLDPELVLLGGPAGTHPALLAAVRTALAGMSPSPVRLTTGTLGPLAPLHGATHLALEHARSTVVPVGQFTGTVAPVD